jgi:hypothetical protein
MSAWVANDQGQIDAAEKLAREALQVGALHRDRWGLGWALFQLGRITLARADITEGIYLLSESAELFEETGDPWSLGRVQVALGLAERARGAREAARRRLLDTLRVLWARQYETLVLHTIAVLGALAADAGDKAGALRLLAVVAGHPATEHINRTRVVELIDRLDLGLADGPQAPLDELVHELLR